MGKPSRAATANDLCGTWAYACTRPAVTVLITFNANGTFDQQVTDGVAAERQDVSGTWQLHGTEIELRGLLVFEEKWETRDMIWFVVHDGLSDHGVAPSGGVIADPDNYDRLRRVR
jgi:hypothetical protein